MRRITARQIIPNYVMREYGHKEDFKKHIEHQLLHEVSTNEDFKKEGAIVWSINKGDPLMYPGGVLPEGVSLERFDSEVRVEVHVSNQDEVKLLAKLLIKIRRRESYGNLLELVDQLEKHGW